MVTIKVRQNGPYVVEGEDAMVVDWNGVAYPIPKRPFALCRCGGQLQRYPEDGLLTALQNVLSFDVFDPAIMRHLTATFQSHGIPVGLPGSGALLDGHQRIDAARAELVPQILCRRQRLAQAAQRDVLRRGRLPAGISRQHVGKPECRLHLGNLCTCAGRRVGHGVKDIA